tara:strand:+ start:8116 stop:9561 length:1446 start_codon:yes stop_codon:yes gene_type:complete
MEHFLQAITVAYYLVAVLVSVRVLLQNRNPIKTTSYLILLLLLPVIGLIIFYFFGQDYRKNKLFSRKGISDDAFINNWTNQLLFRFQEKESLVESELHEMVKIARLLMHNEQAVLTVYNEAEILYNGEMLFPKMLDILSKAKHHIHIEYYIIEDGKIAEEIFRILRQKALEGVEVRLIYDDVGSNHFSSKSEQELVEAGVQVYPFMPVRFPTFTSKVNFRDHRKIVVVDGTEGFVGGINLADRYDNRCNNWYWRDTHLYLKGGAVKSMQLLFFLNWKFASEQTLNPSNIYFPMVETTDHFLPIQIAGSGPDSDWASIMQSYFTAITEANRFVYITTPYFIPNESILTALTTAAQGGVDVKLIVPEESDTKLAHYATRSYLNTLMKAGVHVYMYTKGFIHAKTLVVDNEFCSIGTANMDYRSFNTNFEVNAFIYNKELSEELSQQFLIDLQDTFELTREKWKKRKFSNRILESFSRLFSPIL